MLQYADTHALFAVFLKGDAIYLPLLSTKSRLRNAGFEVSCDVTFVLQIVSLLSVSRNGIAALQKRKAEN